MALEFGILGFLNYGPMSGYDLVKAFESSLEFFWHAQSSHIYLELKKMEKKGYIHGETVIQSERPNKKVFSITDAGREAFMNWLASGPGEDVTYFKSVFLMKVFFSGGMPPDRSADLLRQFKDECGEYLEKMGSVEGSIQNYGAGKESIQTLGWRFTADFGYRFMQTCVEWAENCIKTLEKIE